MWYKGEIGDKRRGDRGRKLWVAVGAAGNRRPYRDPWLAGPWVVSRAVPGAPRRRPSREQFARATTPSRPGPVAPR